MFPFCDSPSPMDMPLYQQLQLQLSPPSPKPDQSSSFYYHPCSPPFAAAASSFHLSYQLGSAANATPPPALINSPELSMHPSMEQPPASKLDPGNAQGAGGVISLDAVSAAAASRKDRHSKICTAGGMRDRRMRLSLDVARKFFALQDMLGFDKASKTVQWLLNTSKAAIQEIMTEDASSECVEDGSSSLSVDGKHNPTEELGRGDQQEKGNGCSEGKKPAKARRATTKPKQPRKSGNAHPVVDKETRAKARERARERTREKHRMRWVKLASAIDVEAAAAGRDRPSTNNLNHSPSMNMTSAAAELEERCSSTLNNGGRTHEVSIASEPSDMILAFGNGGYDGSNYCQEQWELGGVVFANSRFY